MMIARHLQVRGRVQGVGFRYSLQRQAQRLGLAGWVRNRHDGSVEAAVCGPADSVEKLIEWARHGPPGARVTDLKVSPHDASYEGFELRSTA
jgi:acylphosphatase